jgi:DNA invertase Pin-like site-specific DNA recombinase
MNKITPEHLARGNYVYVRQSTADQLLNNPESRRRQYALETRAQALGWQNVVVLDEDLGRSGSGQARPGFERLLAAICAGSAGAVFAIEASRLARNGRDWHTLLEFCAFVDTLIIDEDGVYDPRLVNDRLLLGMKGTFSELELSILRRGKPSGGQQDDGDPLDPGRAAAGAANLRRSALCDPGRRSRSAGGAEFDREWPRSITRPTTTNSVFPIGWRASASCHHPGGAAQDQIAVRVDPPAVGEFLEQGRGRDRAACGSRRLRQRRSGAAGQSAAGPAMAGHSARWLHDRAAG